MHGFHTKQNEKNKHVWQAKDINLDTKENSLYKSKLHV